MKRTSNELDYLLGEIRLSNFAATSIRGLLSALKPHQMSSHFARLYDKLFKIVAHLTTNYSCGVPLHELNRGDRMFVELFYSVNRSRGGAFYVEGCKGYSWATVVTLTEIFEGLENETTINFYDGERVDSNKGEREYSPSFTQESLGGILGFFDVAAPLYASTTASRMSGLSKGDFKKQNSSVDGVYYQDLSFKELYSLPLRDLIVRLSNEKQLYTLASVAIALGFSDVSLDEKGISLDAGEIKRARFIHELFVKRRKKGSTLALPPDLFDGLSRQSIENAVHLLGSFGVHPCEKLGEI